jgi:hypothetical protein
MTVKSLTFQIALLVIIVVGIILIIQSSWTMAQLNKTVGDGCTCSGVVDQEITNLKLYSLMTLILGLGIIVYAILMFVMYSGSRGDHHTSERRVRESGMIASRFASMEV